MGLEKSIREEGSRKKGGRGVGSRKHRGSRKEERE